MAYDSPKAAHFVAYDANGAELAWNDTRGLAARWMAADLLKVAGLTNLMGASKREKQIAQDYADMAGKQTGLRVKFDYPARA